MKKQKNRSTHRVSVLSSLFTQSVDFVKQHPTATSITTLALLILAFLFAATAALTPVIVDDNGDVRTVLTLGRTPNTILAGAGITLADDDSVTATLDGPEKRICIERAFDVSVTLDGTSTVVRLTGGTVNDALELAGVTADKSTVTNVSTSELVSDGLNICVDRLDSQERVETETVDFVTVCRYSDEKPIGSKQVIQKGTTGTKSCRYIDYLQDGKIVRSELVSEELTKQPTNAIVLVGQGAVSDVAEKYPLDENGVPQGYKTVLEGTACAYTAKAGAVTATGTAPQIGTVAVNPKTIPYGSKLFIASDDGYVYGYATAEDTGGALMKNKIIADLYMDTAEDCYAFGRRNVKVYILE